jgi:hypothetical protein
MYRLSYMFYLRSVFFPLVPVFFCFTAGATAGAGPGLRADMKTRNMASGHN